MVYIYKKKVGSKSYYYLRASERKGAKITVKDIAYLGNSASELKGALAKLPRFKDKIRKAYKNIHKYTESNYFLEEVTNSKLKKDMYLEKSLEPLEACKLHYNSVFEKNDAQTKKEILKNFVIEFSFNTASIEGNTITLVQARSLLEDGLTPEGKTLREIYDLQNTKRVFFELYNSKTEISHDLIISIHKKLMKDIDARIGYRTTDIRVIKSNFDATPAPYVKTDMDILLKWYNQQKTKLHPLVLATLFHHKYEKIHPFMDGNGRVGRMLLNLILLQYKNPPVIIHRKLRTEYLEALRTADKADLTKFEPTTYKKLVQFVASELSDEYWQIFL